MLPGGAMPRRFITGKRVSPRRQNGRQKFGVTKRVSRSSARQREPGADKWGVDSARRNASVLRQRKSRANPIILSLRILQHIGVAHIRQSTGGLLGCGSGKIPTVDHDLRSLVGNDSRNGANLVERKTARARQMMFAPVHARQHLEEMKRIAALDLRVKLVPRDGRRHWTFGKSPTDTGCRAAVERAPTPELGSSVGRPPWCRSD